jgi:hypothetical protein
MYCCYYWTRPRSTLSVHSGSQVFGKGISNVQSTLSGVVCLSIWHMLNIVQSTRSLPDLAWPVSPLLGSDAFISHFSFLISHFSFLMARCSCFAFHALGFMSIVISRVHHHSSLSPSPACSQPSSHVEAWSAAGDLPQSWFSIVVVVLRCCSGQLLQSLSGSMTLRRHLWVIVSMCTPSRGLLLTFRAAGGSKVRSSRFWLLDSYNIINQVVFEIVGLNRPVARWWPSAALLRSDIVSFWKFRASLVGAAISY